jgi:hypothetical protein
MKKPIVILWFLFSLVVLAVIFFGRHKATHSTALPSATGSTAAATTPSGLSSTATPKTTVAIQDGKTLDFSSGKPVLKDSADEKAIIAQSVKEMNEAAAGVTFTPASKAPEAGAKKPAPQE